MAGALTIAIIVLAFFTAGGVSAVGILAAWAQRRAVRQATRPRPGSASPQKRWR